MKHTKTKLNLEFLEDRTVPALLLQFDPSGNLTGIFGNNVTAVTLNEGAGTVQVLEGANDLGTYAVVGDLRVSLGNAVGAGTLTVNMAAEFAGSLNVTAGNYTAGLTVTLAGAGPID